MKILRVRLQNLNSLIGEHELDLSRQPFIDDGLFAIVGKTGAGKTTLLDAITLGLYGKMARYQSDSPDFGMNRSSAQCYAEVEFVTSRGRFSSRWERKRARGQLEGDLQPVKRYVYNEEGEPIAEKIREVDDKIVELTGLDYERFLRAQCWHRVSLISFCRQNRKKDRNFWKKSPALQFTRILAGYVSKRPGMREMKLSN